MEIKVVTRSKDYGKCNPKQELLGALYMHGNYKGLPQHEGYICDNPKCRVSP
jgi:hypothetical protein